MTKVSPNNENETISDISTTFEFEISEFMTKVDPKNWNETKSLFFHGTYSTLAPYLFCQEILKHFNDFQNQDYFVYNQTMEIKY